MAGFNGTGPAGMGPMTGRGMGYCNSYPGAYGQGQVQAAGYRVPGYGLGFGHGRGFGRGRGPRAGFVRGCGRGQGGQGFNPALRG